LGKQIELTKLNPIDIDKCSNLDELLAAMSKGSFGGRELGRAWSVLQEVMSRPSCDLILTISGAMSVAQLGLTFGSLIINNIVKCVITTGALVTHSFVQELGLHHFEAPNGVNDEALFKKRLNRIYDSIEPESNLEIFEQHARKAFSSIDSNSEIGSYELIRHLSKELLGTGPKTGLLGATLTKNIDVFVPAFTDSELGLYLYNYSRSCQHTPFLYDPLRDLDRYAEWMASRKEIAFLTIGGSVPRNWGQQMIPYLRTILPKSHGWKIPVVFAAIRICPDSPNLGHLSGSTYSEGISWGKFNNVHKERLIEVYCDATMIFPFLAKTMLGFQRGLSKPGFHQHSRTKA
jgi:deoxyhypusine synthase